jgi:predicted ChrR family anti-sigma factor
MTHTTTTDEEFRAHAALYALDALDRGEALAFEEHVAACPSCASELREFEAVAANLGLAATPAEPPTEVRARLLAFVSAEGEGASTQRESATTAAAVAHTHDDKHADQANPGGERAGFLVVRAGEGQWRATEDAGVSYKLLFADRERGTYTTLLKMEPGSRIPRHRHLGVEQCLVLEGDVRSGRVEMLAGDFNCSLPGSVHEELVTDNGALLLLVSPEHYEVVAPPVL